YSSFYTAGQSSITIVGAIVGDNNIQNAPVTNVTATYLVIKNYKALSGSDLTQAYGAGNISLESQSLFSTLPVLVANGKDPLSGDGGAVFRAFAVDTDDILALDVLEIPEGLPVDLTVELY